MSQSTDIYSTIESLGVVPVVAIDNEAAALPLADALLEGGLPVAEITFRTAAAAAVIRRISNERPDVLVGAGTILTVEQLQQAADAGARFGVAPGFNPAVVQEALRIGFPFAPGVMTPTDIEAALSLGLKHLKFFPAGAAGGIKMLKSIAGPYAHTGVRFIPTGGVTTENLTDYLSEKIVIAAGGTWIAKRDAIAASDWVAITENCRGAVKIVQELRGTAG
jgi:2-dehydro-3-deoxyphosphogluconate aldolase/(4S)-4-hydroxy-2-oxoglutarate aldolase